MTIYNQLVSYKYSNKRLRLRSNINNIWFLGKENFKASEEDWNNFSLEPDDEELSKENIEQRPGTTKRRQYYYKRVATALLDCTPVTNQHLYLYHIVMTLSCPLPEEQNTRGRKIYAPEESLQGFGILTTKEIPPVINKLILWSN